MDTLKCSFGTASLGALALVLPGVAAVSDRTPIIASAAVALFMLLVLIVAIVFASCYAQSWVRGTMRRNGKVKMPRSYFEKKKEAQLRLLAESARSSRETLDTYRPNLPDPDPAPLMNGNVPPAIPPMDKATKRETLVQGWNQNTRRVYEEKGYTMELGDENEDEYRIETTIVDNEVLDVGPYKSLQSTKAKPVDGNVYNNPYLYTNNDRVTVTKSSDDSGVVSASSLPLNATKNGSRSLIDDKIIKL